MLSIIIPTLNEENNIGRLLDSIKSQGIKKLQVIVVDCQSADATQQIVKAYKGIDTKLIVSNMKNIPYQRNLGASKAKYERLLFLDADVMLPKGFLKENLKELADRKLEVAGCYIHPMTDNKIDIFYHKFFNAFLWCMQWIYPHMVGFCIFSTQTIHEKMGGFDNTITLGEDHDYVNRSKRHTKFRMLKSKEIYCSVRRFDKEGRFLMGMKYFLAFFYRVLFGEIRSNIFKYKFGHYNNSKRR